MLNSDHGDFVRSIERMNQMYGLQVSTIPTISILENRANGSQAFVTVAERLDSFKKTLLDEVAEIDAIILKDQEIRGTRGYTLDDFLDVLTAIADVTADLEVFCVSEQRKFGIPPAEVMQIVMASNMSKLQPDGSAKYDERGKFLKGPNYWKPESAIRTLLRAMINGHEEEVVQPVVKQIGGEQGGYVTTLENLDTVQKLVDAHGGAATVPPEFTAETIKASQEVAPKPKLQLEAGKKYLNHSGHERGPMAPIEPCTERGDWRWICKTTGETFRDDGGFYLYAKHGECNNDLAGPLQIEAKGKSVGQEVVERLQRFTDSLENPAECDPQGACHCTGTAPAVTFVAVSGTPPYRPFEGLEEFWPHRDRWIRFKDKPHQAMRPVFIGRKTIAASDCQWTYRHLFEKLVFVDDGSPCGVPLPCDRQS